MNAKKELAKTINHAVQEKLAQSGEQPKKAKKAIEKSAKKLSVKLTGIFEKIQKKADKKRAEADEKQSVPQMIHAPERDSLS